MYFCRKDLWASVGLCSSFHPKSEAKFIGNAAWNVNWDEVGQSVFAVRVKIINNLACHYCKGTDVDDIEQTTVKIVMYM